MSTAPHSQIIISFRIPRKDPKKEEKKSMKSILNEKSSSNIKTDSYNHSYKKKSGAQHSGPSHNKPQEAKQPHKRIRETDMFKPTDNFNVMDVVSGMNKKKEG